MHPHHTIGHRHPQVIGLIPRNKTHRPPRRQIHQTGVHRPTRAQIGLMPLGHREPGQPLTLPQRHRADHPPARTKGQMRLLRRGDEALRPRLLRHGAARGNGGQVQRIRRRQRQQRQLRLGMCDHAAGLHALHLETVSCIGARQTHPHLERQPVGHLQGRQEIKVADLEPARFPLCAQRLRRQLQVSRARHDRIARLGAMLVQHPVGTRLQRLEEQTMPAFVLRDLGQHRRIRRGRSPLGRGIPCQPRGHRIGGHADTRPDPPVDRQNPRLAARARLGIGVQIFIRRHIIDLPHRGCNGGG